MSDIAISVENVSKMYRLGTVSSKTLGDDITRWWANIRGKEDPFSKIAESNDRSKKSDSEYVWSLRDVSFEIKKGESVGLLGRNGAGKSTLLKILSRITTPSLGNINVDGRIASLLEVGTGFNPELTGRENAYMNGAILGMTRKEVASRLDEIIDFSGIEGYIDTPVKRYSSGMYVRLAFSVAAHLSTEILILDEVFAVGDLEFRRKCLDKMEQICYKEGKTIIIVSHAMEQIERLCSKVVYLKEGSLFMEGKTDEIIPFYNKELQDVAKLEREKNRIKEEIKEENNAEVLEEVVKETRSGNGNVRMESVSFINKEGMVATEFVSGEELTIRVQYKAVNYMFDRIKSLNIGFRVLNIQDHFVTVLNNKMAYSEFNDIPLEGTIEIKIPKLPLIIGIYKLKANLHVDFEVADQYLEPFEINVLEGDYYKTGFTNALGRQGIYIDQKWSLVSKN